MQARTFAPPLLVALAVAGCSGAAATSRAGSPEEPRRISLRALEDKVRGGWAGQMIGVSYGAPTEFRSQGKILEGELKW